MLSPQVSVTSPDGGVPARRRGLSYLRGLSSSRLGGGTPPDPTRPSPRSYFARSTSYNESHSLTLRATGRRRSASRPDEASREVGTQSQEQAGERSVRNLTPTRGARKARSLSRNRDREHTEDILEATANEMARHRTNNKRNISTSNSYNTGVNGDASIEDADRRTRERANTDSVEGQETKPKLPTIRFLPHQEIRNGRQSLNFTPISRTLPSETSIIRVGRYSEREGIPITNPTTPSDSPVGFKSKVVSRKHCEFSFVNGQWHVKDVSSSSGTFLNHIRLSQPNLESRLYPVKDGDILQLGIDFRGGEEMIFRCVKIRVECNRSWQKRPNNFNKSRHAQLASLAKEQSAAGGENTGECAICLGPVHPIQALFVAPCAHVWHYKCIRPMLEGKNSTYPQFQCPNCRAFSDLSADVDIEPDDPDDEMMDAEGVSPVNDSQEPDEMNENLDDTQNFDTQGQDDSDLVPVPTATDNSDARVNGSIESERDGTPSPSMRGSGSGLLSRRQAANPTSPVVNSMNNLDMPERFDADETTHDLQPELTRTEATNAEHIISGEGPLTPRNNAGPFVFDGSAGRSSGRRMIASTIEEHGGS